MTSKDVNEWINSIDISSIATPGDKIRECEYFLKLASDEINRDHFRWLITAFLNASYSYFECTALQLCAQFNEPSTGVPISDTEALAILQKYVKVSQRKKDPYYVTTGGAIPITVLLYKYRNKSTHHVPLPIMLVGDLVPENFQIGSEKGSGTHALDFCRDIISLIHHIQYELDF